MAKKTNSSNLLDRPPVIAVLGHVDHGKTTLLDSIRKAHVADTETGGITQGVRAHKVTVELTDGRRQPMTFIDTPGHEAFSEMRSRGAQVTDVALLVVAADDGVMPQTKEAISFIKQAKSPTVVAINKVDLPGANVAKVKQQLSTEDILLEEFGGDVIAVEISAKKGTNIDKLLDTLVLVAEVNGLKNEKPIEFEGRSVVLESTLSKTLGAISLVLIKTGTVEIGHYLATDNEYFKIRALKDETFKNVDKGEVSDPVWIAGLSRVVETGVVLYSFETEAEAKKYIKSKEEHKKEQEENSQTAEELFASLIEAESHTDKKVLKVVLRADVQGSLEVLQKELIKLSDDEVSVEIVEANTGDLTEQDIHKAKDIRGLVIGFRSGYPDRVKKAAQRDKVIVMNYDLIYELIDDVDEAMSSLVEPQQEEVEIASARVKQVFTLTNGSLVSGSIVEKGIIKKGFKVFVRRGEERIGEGKITSLRHLKNEVKEVNKGTECGILIDPKLDIQEGDEIVCYKIEKI